LERQPDWVYDDFLETNHESIKVFRKGDRWVYLDVNPLQEWHEIDLSYGDYLSVCRKGKWGMMDGKGNILTEFLSDWVMPHPQIFVKYEFVPSLFQHFSLTHGLLDKSGKLMMEADFLSVSPVESSFLVERETGYGLVTAQGKWVLQANHQEIFSLNPELLAAKSKNAYVTQKLLKR
jgi:hypothetical protein